MNEYVVKIFEESTVQLLLHKTIQAESHLEAFEQAVEVRHGFLIIPSSADNVWVARPPNNLRITIRQTKRNGYGIQEIEHKLQGE